jgi:hypothetical protein
MVITTERMIKAVMPLKTHLGSRPIMIEDGSGRSKDGCCILQEVQLVQNAVSRRFFQRIKRFLIFSFGSCCVSERARETDAEVQRKDDDAAPLVVSFVMSPSRRERFHGARWLA